MLFADQVLKCLSIDDPLANDVAQHWKDNEKEAIATGMFSFVIEY